MKPDLNKKPNAATQRQMTDLMAYLAVHRLRPVPAIDIAGHLSLGGNREAKRRRVRMLVEMLHGAGYRVCAGDGGYWIARSHLDWKNYEDAKKRNARYRFVVIKKTADAVTHRKNKQGSLFDEPAPDGSRKQWAEAF